MSEQDKPLVPCEKGCPDGELCKRLGRHIHGKNWEIWSGTKDGMTPGQMQLYKSHWERAAQVRREQPDIGPKKSEGCGCVKPR